ncbi:MAG: DedA family protein [Candidatus Gracilibacteria bacterium]|jgi:membrane protein DedA with SNARE-associated domain
MPFYLATILSTVALSQHIYILFFIAGIIEGPIASTLAGFLSAHGYMHFGWAYFVMLMGDEVADTIYYLIGFLGREKVVKKYGKYLKIRWEDIEKVERLFENHPAKTIITAKITHILGVPFLLAAGLARTNFIKFTIYNTIATAPKTLGFIILGYYSKQAGDQINAYLKIGTFIGIAIFVLFIMAYFILSRYFYNKMIAKTNLK